MSPRLYARFAFGIRTNQSYRPLLPQRWLPATANTLVFRIPICVPYIPLVTSLMQLIDKRPALSDSTLLTRPLFPTAVGFTNGPGGPHTSRTMMLAELRLLLSACPPGASLDDYRAAAVEENALLKSTYTTRLRTLKSLRELYTLDRSKLLFRALRDLWDADVEAQPLLALLCAIARDRPLRASSEAILASPVGTPVTSQMLAEAVKEQLPSQYNVATLAKIGRNTASSWTQSGHLGGRTKKARTHATSRPAGVAYALLLGHLTDIRGDALFESLWSRLLDAPVHVLREQAATASKLGWIEYRHTGAVTDISFHYLLREKGQEARL